MAAVHKSLANAIVIINWALLGSVTLGAVSYFANEYGQLEILIPWNQFLVNDSKSHTGHAAKTLLKMDLELRDELFSHKDQLILRVKTMTGHFFFHALVNIWLTFAVLKSNRLLLLLWTGVNFIAYLTMTFFLFRDFNPAVGAGFRWDWDLYEFTRFMWIGTSCLVIVFHTYRLEKLSDVSAEASSEKPIVEAEKQLIRSRVPRPPNPQSELTFHAKIILLLE